PQRDDTGLGKLRIAARLEDCRGAVDGERAGDRPACARREGGAVLGAGFAGTGIGGLVVHLGTGPRFLSVSVLIKPSTPELLIASLKSSRYFVTGLTPATIT